MWNETKQKNKLFGRHSFSLTDSNFEWTIITTTIATTNKEKIFIVVVTAFSKSWKKEIRLQIAF